MQKISAQHSGLNFLGVASFRPTKTGPEQEFLPEALFTLRSRYFTNFRQSVPATGEDQQVVSDCQDGLQRGCHIGPGGCVQYAANRG